MKRDFYEILGVSKTSTAAEIKAAYRKLALQYHPDRNKAADAEEKFKEINEAYEVLSNQEKRNAYDQFGHAAFDPSAGGFGGRTYSSQSGPFNFSWQSYGGGNPYGGSDFEFEGFSNPFDIFEQFFGGGFGAGRQARIPTYHLDISFMDAVNGVEKEVILDGKKKKVKIPPGVDDGTRIKFSDFILYINVGQSDTFRREGNDIFVDVPITFSQASLGDDIQVPTLEGNLKIRVKPGTQPNTLIRLKEKGVRALNSYRHGDLFIRLVVQVPTHLTAKQKELLKELGL